MCRLYAFRANEPTKVECPLVRAQNAMLGKNRSDDAPADGWGIVCYEGEEPILNHRANAAFADTHFSEIAERTFAKTVVAHLRCRTVGVNAPLNTHPFTFGRWTFAHNGTIPLFNQVEAELTKRISSSFLDARLGSTDSELYFLWLLHCLTEAGLYHSSDTATASQVLEEGMRELMAIGSQSGSEQHELNYVMTNGKELFACRWNNPLFQLTREGVYDCPICGISHIQNDPHVTHRAVILASEPITREAWTSLPNYSILTVNEDLSCSLHSLQAIASKEIKS